MSDVPVPSSFDSDFFDENRWQKFIRRLKEEPLIPFGVGVTCWAFLNAAKSIRTGNASRTNQFFRYRLYAQSFTLVAMLGGSYYYNADRLKRKEYTDLVKQRKSQEKRDAWIRELEARDEEDKNWRDKLGKARDFQREEMEREAIEEKRRREGKSDGKSDDGRGVIGALKEQMKIANDAEAKEEAAELEQKREAVRQKRQEVEKKQEAEKMKQAMVKQDAKMGPDTRVWGEDGGGIFGWKRIRDWFNKPKSGEGKD